MLGYEVGSFHVVRYYSKSTRSCPKGIKSWFKLDRIKKFANINKKLNLGKYTGTSARMDISEKLLLD